MKDDVKMLKLKIKAAKEELKTAGPIHKRDLKKYISRMEALLKSYERFHRTSDLKLFVE